MILFDFMMSISRLTKASWRYGLLKTHSLLMYLQVIAVTAWVVVFPSSNIVYMVFAGLPTLSLRLEAIGSIRNAAVSGRRPKERLSACSRWLIDYLKMASTCGSYLGAKLSQIPDRRVLRFQPPLIIICSSVSPLFKRSKAAPTLKECPLVFAKS